MEPTAEWPELGPAFRLAYRTSSLQSSELVRSLETAGWEVGPKQRNDPRGLMFPREEAFDVGGWRTISAPERGELHGVFRPRPNFRAGTEGLVEIWLSPRAPIDGIRELVIAFGALSSCPSCGGDLDHQLEAPTYCATCELPVCDDCMLDDGSICKACRERRQSAAPPTEGYAADWPVLLADPEEVSP